MKSPLFVVSVLSAALSISSQAAVFTWSGGGANGDWATTGNWVGGVAPVLSDTTQDLRFLGVTGTTVTVAAGAYAIQDIIFGPATGSNSTTDGAFTLSGSNLTIQGNGTYAIYNNTNKLQTINNNLTISSTSAAIVSGGGSGLVLSGSVTMGFASGNLRVIQNCMSSTTPLTLNGVISSGAGTGGLSLTGAGAQYGTSINLNGANTYVGTTAISGVVTYLGGNAPVSAAGVFGNSSTAVQLGATTSNGGANAYTAVLTNGAYTIDRSFILQQTDSNYQRIVIGSNSASASTYTGTIQVSNGATANGIILVAGGGTVNFTGSKEQNGNIIYREATATGTADTVTKIGSGTVTLQGQSNYLGATIIDLGTLSVNMLANGGAAGSALGKATSDASNLRIQGGTLQYTGAATSTDRLFTIGASGATIDASGAGAVNFTNTGAIVTADAASRQATLNANGHITFLTSDVGGAADVSDLKVGMLVTDASGLIPAGTTIASISMNSQNGLPYIFLSGTIPISSATTTQLTFGYANASANPTNLALTGNNTGNNTLAGALSDSVGYTPLQITKNGSGTWVLSGSNTYSGTTTVNAGMLTFAKKGALYGGDSSQWISSNITVNSGATLAVNAGGTNEFSGTDISALLAGLSSGSNNGLRAGSLFGIDTTNASGEVGVSSNITNTTGTGGGALGLVKFGTGVLTLSGSNSYTGTTTVNGGTLKLGSTSALGASSLVTVALAGTLDFNGQNYTTAVGSQNNIYGRLTNSSATAATYVTTLTTGTGTTVDGVGDINLSGAVFGSAGGSVTKSGTNTLTLSGGVNNTSLAMTVNGGTLVLQKSSGQGALRGIDGNGNALTINAGGTVKLGANDQFRNSYDLLTGIVSIYGGTFNVNGFYSTVDGLRIGSTDGSTAGSLIDSVGGGYLAVSGTGSDGANAIVATNGTVSAVLAGSLATFTKKTSGTVTLSGANTYGGLTTVNAGELDLNTTGTQSIAGNLTVAGGVAKLLQANQLNSAKSLAVTGGTFNIQGFNTTLGGVQVTSTGSIIGSGGTITITSAYYDMQGGSVGVVLGGTAGLTKTVGTTNATLSAVNTYTGVTTLGGGILSVNNLGNGGVNSGIGSSSSAATNLVFNSGTLQYTGGATSTDRNFTITANGGGFDASGSGALTLSGSATNNAGSGTAILYLSGTNTAANTVSSNITNGASAITALTKNGTGTWTLSGANTYTGQVLVNGGILKMGSASALGASTNIYIAASGTLDMNGQNVSNVTSNNIRGGLTNTGAAATSANNWGGITSNSVTVDGTGDINLSGALNSVWMVKNGSNTLTISGVASNVASTIAVNSGTVILNKTAGVAGNGMAVRGIDAAGNIVTVNTGGTVILGASEQIRATDAQSGIVAVYGGTFDVNSKSETINGLQIGSTDGSTAGNVISTGGGGSLIIQGVATTTGTSRVFAMNGTVSANLSGTGSFIKTTNATVTLSGSNSYWGTTTISAGTLQLGVGGTTGLLSGSSAIVDNGNLTINRSNVVAQGTDFSGAAITGTGSFTQAGTGKTTLSAVNTYSGATTITSGTLALGATASIANSPTITVGTDTSSGTVLDLTAKSSFDILSGQTLGGNGTVNIGAGKTLTVDYGAHWAPGNSIGTNAVTGNLTLAGIADFQLGTTGTSHASPGLSDRTNVTGTLALGGSLNLIDNAGANSNGSVSAGSYLLFTQAAVSGSFSTINAIGSGASVLHSVVNTSIPGDTFLDVYRLAAATTPATTVALGNVRVGSALTGTRSITNTASGDGYSELLKATVTGNGTGFTGVAGASAGNVVYSLGTPLTAGTQGGTASVVLASTGVGTFADTTLSTTGVNLSGAAYDYAKPTYSTTLAIGHVHVGDTKTLSVANTTVTNASYQDSLNVAANNGGNSNLAVSNPGNIAAGQSGNITYTANSAGLLDATSNLGLTSNANGVTGLSNQGIAGSVAVTGAAYNYAAASTVTPTVNLGIVHVGGTFGSSNVNIKNTAASGSYTEGLDASVKSTTASATASGSITNLAGQSTDVISVGLGGATHTSTVGAVTGQVNIGFTSNGTNSGLTSTTLGSQAVTVNGQVNDYATPILQLQTGATASLTHSTLTSYLLDLGTVDVNSGTVLVSMDALNKLLGTDATYQDALSGSLSGLSKFTLSSGSSVFSGVAAGNGTEWTFGFDTTNKTSATYVDQLVLSLSSDNASGSSTLDSISLDLQVQVVPEPSTWAMLVGGLGLLVLSSRRFRRLS